MVTLKIKELNLTVGQAFCFYEIIGEDDKNSIILIESHEDTNKEQQNINPLVVPKKLDEPDEPNVPTDPSDPSDSSDDDD